jgi:thioredoxin reductase
LSFGANRNRVLFTVDFNRQQNAGTRLDFIYPDLGSDIAEFVIQAGAAAPEEGCICLDRHQRISVRGVYANGTVCSYGGYRLSLGE